jgi:N-acetylmuramoyl-L-alanine amidase
MKRAAALASAVTLLLLAAPALSLGPFRPEPVEFELVPQADSTEENVQGKILSTPLRAPKRFNLVGLTWEGDTEPEIHVRVRQAGEGWGPWTEVPAHPDGGPDPGTSEKSAEGTSSPAWAGEADYVQYRLSKPVSNLRLKFVNASGTATRADQVKTGVIGSMTAVSQGVTRLLTAEADPQPAIKSRSSWGGEKCPPRRAPDYGEVKASFVHHTVNANDYKQSDVPKMILSICRYHRNTNGWDDIGYNFLVDKYGTLWEGRAGGIDKAVVGAQAQGYNAQSTGIANLGTNTSVEATSISLDAMASLIRWKLPSMGHPRRAPSP